MAKKKKRKKHQLKYAAPTKSVTPKASALAGSAAKAAAVSSKKTSKTESSEFGYVKRDLRSVGILAAAFVTLMLLLWLGFEHTGLGTAVYQLIKL